MELSLALNEPIHILESSSFEVDVSVRRCSC